MALSFKHLFQSLKTDGPDNTLVQPSDWNDEHVITCGAGKVLGRENTTSGAVQELPLSFGSAGNADFDVGTGFLGLPTGTTGQRTGSRDGLIRYNSTLGAVEARIAGAWKQFIGSIVDVVLTMSGAAFNEAVRVDVASAGTCDIGAAASNYIRITGTTTINSFGTIASGVRRHLIFQGVLTLTHNNPQLRLPNNGNDITTSDGDCATFISEGSGNWKCVHYTRNNGTSITGYSPPQRAYFFGTFSAGALTDRKKAGMTVTRTGSGLLECTLSPAMPDAFYRVLATTKATIPGAQGEWVFEDTSAGSRTTTKFYLMIRGGGGTTDPDAISIEVFE